MYVEVYQLIKWKNGVDKMLKIAYNQNQEVAWQLWGWSKDPGPPIGGGSPPFCCLREDECRG